MVNPVATGAPNRVILRPRSGWRLFDFGDVWRYRELLWFLALRDIKLRYKQTALGVAWAVLQPVLTMIAFTVIFGKLGGLDRYTSVPYPILTFAALLPWQLFAGSVANSANSLVSNPDLLTKVYCPRIILPVAAVVSNLVDFLVSFIVLIGLMQWYGIALGPRTVLLPFFVGFAVATALAVGLWLSALNVRYRDIRHAIPFLVMLWMYLTPIAYPMSIVPEEWRTLYALNPVVGVVEGFRWALVSGESIDIGAIAASAAATGILFLAGLVYFQRSERSFADVI